jgi:voltage-gated sodium channel
MVLRRSRQTSAVSHRNAAARVVDSSPFTIVVVATIAVNAVVLGLQTYEGVAEDWGALLDAINAACVTVFVVELLTRLASYWPRPWEFFRNAWNVFDFVVVGATFVPGVAQNSTLLRLASASSACCPTCASFCAGCGAVSRRSRR